MKKILSQKKNRHLPYKLSLRMKLSVLFTFTALLTMHANDSYAQRTRITLNLQDVPVSRLLDEIESKTDFRFVYQTREVDLDRTVSVKGEQEKVIYILDKVFQNTGTAYRIIDKQIFLKKSIEPKVYNNKARSEIKNIRNQQFQVSGSVTDENGTPLPGANIVEKGTTNGVTADFDGNFSLNVADSNSVLVVSYIGFATKEVNVNGQANVAITLAESASALDEIVVVGYGTQKKSDLTGALSSIGDEDFNPGVNASVDQLMQGRSSGVQISQTSGEPGGGVSVRIRGSSSINAGNEPLYVIDGLPIDNSPMQAGGGVAGLGPDSNPRNPLNSMNPNDIESIEVLKDASATAIYGSRGANGVILITTKKGSAGKIQVNYDVYSGLQATAERMDILSTRQYIDVINGISEDSGNGTVFSESDITNIGDGTDWLDQVYRSAPVTSQNLSVSGGNDKTTFLTSLNYLNQEGIVKNSGIEKYVARVNVKSDIEEKIQIGINVNTSVIENENNVDGESFEEQGGAIASALFYDPTEPIFNPDGTYARSSNITINNPVAVLNGVSSSSKENRVFGNVYFQYDILDELDAKLSFGYDNFDSKRKVYNSRLTVAGAAAGGIANISTLNRSNINLEYTMNYTKQLKENSSLNVLGGITYQEFNNEFFSGNIQGFPSDQTGTANLGLGDTGFDDLNSNENTSSLLSYLGRVNYNLHNKYLVTASLRADGSSRFGKNNKYGYFPAFALAWKLNEEGFIPSTFDQLKLRASWGVTGNQEIGDYNYISTLAPGLGAVFNNQLTSSISPTRIANPDLKWESTDQLDIGIDASIWEGRLSGTVDYFIKNTKDMLVNVPLPNSSGYSSQLSNVGQMKNKGIEVFVNSTNIQTPNFSWDTTINFSSIKNEVTDLGDVGDIITGSIKATGNTSIIREGEPLFSYYGYDVVGIFQEGDNISESAQPEAQPGYPIFKDVNGDNIITPDDRVVIGNPNPNLTFGLSNTLSYKNLELSIFILGQQGADLVNANVIQSLYPKNPRRNIVAKVGLNRWTPENTGTKWPSGVNYTAYGGGQTLNSLSVLDASYIQIKNVRLSYNVPQNIIESLQVYLTAQNLVTFTDYVGSNPDANVLGRSNARIDFSTYPLARTILLGFNLQL